jgi:transposase-like protein
MSMTTRECDPAPIERRAEIIPLGTACFDREKVLLAVKNTGGETSQAWRAILDDLVTRELRKPEFLIVDGAIGLEQALAALWGDVPTQRCTVHRHRNLLAHAPQRLHDEVSADYDLRRLAGRDRTAPPRLSSQMAAQMQGGSRQPRRGR